MGEVDQIRLLGLDAHDALHDFLNRSHEGDFVRKPLVLQVLGEDTLARVTVDIEDDVDPAVILLSAELLHHRLPVVKLVLPELLQLAGLGWRGLVILVRPWAIHSRVCIENVVEVLPRVHRGTGHRPLDGGARRPQLICLCDDLTQSPLHHETQAYVVVAVSSGPVLLKLKGPLLGPVVEEVQDERRVQFWSRRQGQIVACNLMRHELVLTKFYQKEFVGAAL